MVCRNLPTKCFQKIRIHHKDPASSTIPLPTAAIFDPGRFTHINKRQQLCLYASGGFISFLFKILHVNFSLKTPVRNFLVIVSIQHLLIHFSRLFSVIFVQISSVSLKFIFVTIIRTHVFRELSKPMLTETAVVSVL